MRMLDKKEELVKVGGKLDARIDVLEGRIPQEEYRELRALISQLFDIVTKR